MQEIVSQSAEPTIEQRKEESLRPLPALRKGRLVARTATGDIRKERHEFVIVPLESALVLLQELAVRVAKPEAPVSSSLAGRVGGEEAYRAWLSLSVETLVPLALASPRGRLAFLQHTLRAARGMRSVAGIEPVLASAVNGAWPWLSLATTERILDYVGVRIARSDFAQSHVMPVLDPNRRSVSLFEKGGLPRLDLREWRADRSLWNDSFVSGALGLGPLGSDMGVGGALGRAIDAIFGARDRNSMIDGLLSGNDNSGAPGGLPGMGDLPGKGSGGKPHSQDTAEGVIAGLLGGQDNSGVPGGLPGMGDLPGKKGTPARGNSNDLLNDLLGSIPGSEYGDITGFLGRHGPGGFARGGFADATPGGPFAPPGQLGIYGEGASGWDDAVRDISTGIGIASAVVIAVYLAPAAVAEAPAVALGAAVAAAGVGAGMLIGLGASEAVEAYKASDQPPTTDSHPTPKDDTKPEPPKDKPRNGDLYPDPIGGGGGDPTQLPAYDGQGGGNPTQLPDSDGTGGGRPNTIWGVGGVTSLWEDDLGGGGPTIRPESFAATVFAGDGLRAGIVQTGRATLHY